MEQMDVPGHALQKHRRAAIHGGPPHIPKLIQAIADWS